jgi:hypothetical protein
MRSIPILLSPCSCLKAERDGWGCSDKKMGTRK